MHTTSVRLPEHPYGPALDATLTDHIDREGARTSSPPPLASGRVGSIGPADALLPMSPLELVLFGAACYLFGVVSGAVVIPWLVDRGLFPVRRQDP